MYQLLNVAFIPRARYTGTLDSRYNLQHLATRPCVGSLKVRIVPISILSSKLMVTSDSLTRESGRLLYLWETPLDDKREGLRSSARDLVPG